MSDKKNKPEQKPDPKIKKIKVGHNVYTATISLKKPPTDIEMINILEGRPESD